MVMKCRFCNSKLNYIFADLGNTPFANSYLNQQQIYEPEKFYPLKAYVCSKCFLVQLDEFEKPQKIFSEYAYMSSFSDTWLKHIEDFVNSSIKKFEMKKNKVVEIASNDGYLLQFFKKKKIPVLGIEPAKNVARIANKKRIPTLTKFFGVKTAKDIANNYGKANFLIAFNVLPHVPNLADFVKGLKILLDDDGIIIIQFSAYLPDLIKKNEFDLIYHEHFSYFSVYTLQKIFAHHGLTIFDLEKFSIHGGSMRLYIKHKKNKKYIVSRNVKKQLLIEKKFGITQIQTYQKFQEKIIQTKKNIWKFFINSLKENKILAAYGAPAKANTLLNYCGVGSDLIPFTVDKNYYKQGLFLPGTHIPIYNPDKILKIKPDFLLILAWNLKDEICDQMSFIKKWGGKFVVLIPEVKIF